MAIQRWQLEIIRFTNLRSFDRPHQLPGRAWYGNDVNALRQIQVCIFQNMLRFRHHVVHHYTQRFLYFLVEPENIRMIIYPTSKKKEALNSIVIFMFVNLELLFIWNLMLPVWSRFNLVFYLILFIFFVILFKWRNKANQARQQTSSRQHKRNLNQQYPSTV